MHGNGRKMNLAIAGVVAASTLIFAGTAAARSGSAGFGHTRHAWPSGMSRNASAAHSSAATRAPWYRESGRNTPDARASRPPAADQHRGSYSPAPATWPSRQGVSHGNSPSGGAAGAESPQAGQDYRQHRVENRHSSIAGQQANTGSAPAESPQASRDYRQIGAQNRYAANSGVVLAPVQPGVYAASAPVAGYGTSAGNNLLPLAGLLADAVSALVDYLRADGQYEANQAYDRGDRPWRMAVVVRFNTPDQRVVLVCWSGPDGPDRIVAVGREPGLARGRPRFLSRARSVA
jgi:hypothetical protein